VEIKTSISDWLMNGMIPEDCDDLLDRLGVSREAMSGALRDMVILNGVGSQVALSDLLPTNDPGYHEAVARDLRVGHSFGDGGRTGALAEFGGDRVWVNPRRGFFDVSGWSANGGTLMHESLHNLGMLDGEIQLALFGTQGQPSVNISEAFANKCLTPDKVPNLP
jgi:hypothetical protein